MSFRSPGPKRRLHRLAIIAGALAIAATGLWLLVWTTVERQRRETWIAAVQHLEVAAEARIDPLDSSPLGRFRTWLKIPRTHVQLWRDSEGRRLLFAPGGEPRGVLIHLERPLSADVLDQLAARFPEAEFRKSRGGMGGMGGQGFF
ncbi:hypothetical protein Pan44_35660 [Caulifigura coniformis]|uniref:Uncharacterized protein n=1 Tax=Caulifigura coniformis TaxID=2527983 RepID=A0A517SHD1_9PLAN|nr:hypothetical protein [Caulifigura coniformis]QDT55522.1 hypothetical protein Pan44_35660 [Caulifigura coniformis]